MKDIKFRDLLPSEIECRVGATLKDQNGNPYAFQIMLYKTARVDCQILDETFGQFGWKNNYYQVKNTMICSVSIWDEDKHEWINKDNGGDDDFTMEQVKAECSDSMKRACFNLGIGRKLYSASKIYMVVNIDKDNDPKKSKYIVKDIGYDDTSITKITIANKKTKQVVISYGTDEKVSVSSQNQGQNTTATPKSSITASDVAKTYEDNLALIGRFAGKLDNDKYVQFFNWLETKFKTRELKDLTYEQAEYVIGAWKMRK